MQLLLTIGAIALGWCLTSVPFLVAGQPKPLPGRTEDNPLPKGAIARLGTLDLRHGLHIKTLAFSPDGNYLATGGADQLVYLHDRKTGQTKGVGRGSQFEIGHVEFSAHGKMLLSLDSGVLRLWEV